MLVLENKPGLLLTDEETSLIEQAVCDNATGNHWLGRKRPDGYWKMRKEIYYASIIIPPTDRQKQINEYYKQCSDYWYWKSLPDEQKLFIEVER